jgi:ribosome-associated protein
MITINDNISLDPAELSESFIRSSGPGGQNVNKVSTAVQLRFDIRHSPSLPVAVRRRAEGLAGRRLSKDGVIVITANRYRTREQNRDDARQRLVDLLTEAAIAPKYRRPTRPTRASKERRLDGKQNRSRIKQSRGRVRGDD